MKRTNLRGLKKRAIGFNLKEYPKFQTFAGSANASEYKAVFLQILFHFESLTDNNVRTLGNLIWGIRQTVSKSIKDDIFHPRYLTNVDSPDSIKTTGLCCVKIEFTFYPNDLYTKKQLIDTLNYVSDNVNKHNFIDTDKYRLYKTQTEARETK